ncbi:MAG: hypothetical protein COV79_03440, partial [Parcubacteria group bacterium CG11_big_fil_rev_8_21_14_0_20_41_14]
MFDAHGFRHGIKHFSGLAFGKGQAPRRPAGLGVAGELNAADLLPAESPLGRRRAIDAHRLVVATIHHYDLKPVPIWPGRVKGVVRSHHPEADSRRVADSVPLAALVRRLGLGLGRNAHDQERERALVEQLLDQARHLHGPVGGRPWELQSARHLADSHHIQQSGVEQILDDRGPIQVDFLHQGEVDLRKWPTRQPQETDEGVGIHVGNDDHLVITHGRDPAIRARRRICAVLRAVMVEVAQAVGL